MDFTHYLEEIKIYICLSTWRSSMDKQFVQYGVLATWKMNRFKFFIPKSVGSMTSKNPKIIFKIGLTYENQTTIS